MAVASEAGSKRTNIRKAAEPNGRSSRLKQPMQIPQTSEKPVPSLRRRELSSKTTRPSAKEPKGGALRFEQPETSGVRENPASSLKRRVPALKTAGSPPKKAKGKSQDAAPTEACLPSEGTAKEDFSRTGDWRSAYDMIKELREDRTAPVDTFGSEALPARPPAVTQAVFEFQCLIALMLSSQTKDPVVGAAIERLRGGLGDGGLGGLSVEGVAAASEEQIRDLIYGVGFHNTKAKSIKRTTALIQEQGGQVPSTFKGLIALPGVGPKMALIVLNAAFGKVEGISIDTHLHRMMNQLGWVSSKTPEETRKAIEGWLPTELWQEINLIWVGFGQELQTEKPKLLRKAIACSNVPLAFKLLKRLGFDIKKVAANEGIELPHPT